MEFSGRYSSIQPVQKGDVVQLVLGREGFVMKVYEKQSFAFERGNLNVLKRIVIFNEYIITVRETNRGNIVIEAFVANVSIWSQTITALTVFDLSLVVGNSGVFLLMNADGVITLPNGSTIQQDPTRVVIRFSLRDGTMIGYSTIQGPTFIDIIYDNEINVALLHGNSTTPLIINGINIVDKSSLYSFIVSLSPTLTPTNTLIVDDAIIDRIAAGRGNIAYTERINGETELSFYTIGGSSWTKSLGVFNVAELEILNNFVAVLGNDPVAQTWTLYQYTFDGTEINNVILPVEGVIRNTQLAFNQNRFILYTIHDLQEVNPVESFLTEYDIYDDVVVWRTPISQSSTLLTGDVSLVAIGNENNLTVYRKRLPALIGAVSEVLWPLTGTGTTGQTGCPPGFHPCSGCEQCEAGCTGASDVSGCCPDNILPGCRLPYIVNVDFILTRAFSPVIPGQEYFLNTNNEISIDERSNRYIGTALDRERVLMLATGSFAP